MGTWINSWVNPASPRCSCGLCVSECAHLCPGRCEVACVPVRLGATPLIIPSLSPDPCSALGFTKAGPREGDNEIRCQLGVVACTALSFEPLEIRPSLGPSRSGRDAY